MMVAKYSGLKDIPKLQEVKRIPVIQCPKCHIGRMFKEDNELICVCCGKTIYTDTLPKVNENDVH